VRVVRIWNVPSFLNPEQPNSIEMVLVDDKVVLLCSPCFLFVSFFVINRVCFLVCIVVS
jgi:hypothetical protein